MKRILLLFAVALSLRAETVLLWPNGAPFAQGTADEDKPSLALYPAKGDNKISHGRCRLPRRRLCASRHGKGRHAHRGVAQPSRHQRVRAEVPFRAEISSSG